MKMTYGIAGVYGDFFCRGGECLAIFSFMSVYLFLPFFPLFEYFSKMRVKKKVVILQSKQKSGTIHDVYWRV